MARNQIWELLKDLDTLAVSLGYNGPAKAAESVISDLQAVGPIWTGKFSNSWQITTPTGVISGGTGAVGPAKPVGAPLLKGKDFARIVSAGARPFRIHNTTNYADQATDLAPFRPTGRVPDPMVGNFVMEQGTRPEGGLRGELIGEGINVSTAKLDWFTNYAGGGQLDKTVARAMRKNVRGFRR